MKIEVLAAPAELPFLVVHGEVIWIVLVGLLVLMSHAAVHLFRRWRASRKARAAVAASLGFVSRPDAGALVLRGRLRGGTATSVARAQDIANRTSGALWLDHDGERIPLIGPVRVEHGTRELAWWLRIGRRRAAALGTLSWRLGSTIAREVKDGDDVLVEGFLRARPPGDEGYRDRPGWECVPIVDAIRVMAAAPRSRPYAHGPGMFVMVTAVLVSLWYSVLSFAGDRALRRAIIDPPEPVAGLHELEALAIAAAMPGSRTEALSRLSWHLETRARHTEHVLQLQVAAAELEGTCPMEIFGKAARFEEALAAARRCGTPRDVALQLAFLGRYDEGLAVVSRERSPQLATLLAIGAGKWKEAALTAERLADNRARKREGDDSAEARGSIAEARCRAALYRSFAGESAPFANVEDKALSVSCAVLEALSLPDEQQAEVLGAIDLRSDHQLTDKVNAFRVAAGGTIDLSRYRSLPASHWRLPEGDGLIWLAPVAASAHVGSDQTSIASLQLAGAALSLFKGNVAEARREAASALAHPAVAKAAPRIIPLLIDLHDPIALFAPGPVLEPAHTEDGEMTRLRMGVPVELEWTGVHGKNCEADLTRAITVAVGGDGLELAEVFERCHVFWSRMATRLLGILPRVTVHREELAAALRLYRDEHTIYSLTYVPFYLLDRVAKYRDLARFAGDTEEEARLQRLFDRHAAVLADRKRLTALIMWAE